MIELQKIVSVASLAFRVCTQNLLLFLRQKYYLQRLTNTPLVHFKPLVVDYVENYYSQADCFENYVIYDSIENMSVVEIENDNVIVILTWKRA